MFLVKIMEYGNNKPHTVMKAATERAAERIERGANINLNHDKFYTVVEGEKCQE